MLASKRNNDKWIIIGGRAPLAKAIIVFVLAIHTGCCQMVLRGPMRGECGAPLIDCVDPNQCESAEDATFNRLHELRANLQMQREIASARISDHFHVCSAKMSDSWNQSCIARWKAEQREKISAPPYPRFHPIPTHPTFYPETLPAP
jgi:hypothetical protein